MNRAAFVVLCLALAVPASAETQTHLLQVYSAYSGDGRGNVTNWAGYASVPSNSRVYVGTLVIDPGENWRNYAGAAQASVEYTITSVTLQKDTPKVWNCPDVFPQKTIVQTGTENIRLNWPLLYESSDTRWTLTINYVTPTPWDDDGPAGPHLATTTHTDMWVWHLDTDHQHLRYLLSLMRDIEVGTSGVSAVNDEALYADLLSWVQLAEVYYSWGDTAGAAAIMADFELAVMDHSCATPPSFPNPTGPGTGILNTSEHPACCKLSTDIEYILMSGG